MILGVGSFAHSIGQTLADAGARKRDFDVSHAQLRTLLANARRENFFTRRVSESGAADPRKQN